MIDEYVEKRFKKLLGQKRFDHIKKNNWVEFHTTFDLLHEYKMHFLYANEFGEKCVYRTIVYNKKQKNGFPKTK